MIKRLINLTTLAALLSLCGCNVLGLAADTVAGGSSTPKVFSFPKHPTVVIAENFANPADADVNSEPLSRYLSDDLAAHQISPQIDPTKVYSLKSENPSRYRALTIAAIGREVGAEQVLYIDILHADVEEAEASNLLRGKAEVRLKLVNAKNGATIWPTDSSDGYPVSAETRYISRNTPGGDEPSVRAALLRALAEHITTLFYTVKHD